ncbi:hypothetical protein Ga0074812_13813 [Parafrankia irregularis]|uniref:Uncharacterized protein n=1 Tax=Parafrankia irregularis TaxID=795642 RepID=A0A0S4R0N6_9ACTN|nr:MULTISPECIES: hypothetical protein [Parafrankia]MBE3201425.1 hypothetical protein [Parafrankia sp. CH37]CUU60298.1 hypothetical protein Ga0074812_13813 [Parafrankia irregularis]
MAQVEDSTPRAADAQTVFHLPLLTVTVTTTDPEAAGVALDYWRHSYSVYLPGYPAWAVKVAEIRARTKGRTVRLDEYIRTLCVATHEKPDCAECGGSFVALNRSQLDLKLGSRCARCVALSGHPVAPADNPAASAAGPAERSTSGPEQVGIDGAVLRFFPIVETGVLVEDLRRCDMTCLAVLDALTMYAPCHDPIPAVVDPSWSRPLTPGFQVDYLDRVVDSGFLRVHPASPASAFMWPDGESRPPVIGDIRDVSWYVAGEGTSVERLAFLDLSVAEIFAGPWTLAQYEDVIATVQDLVAAEVRAYVMHRLRRVGLGDLAPEDSARLDMTIESISGRHSLGACYRFVASVARDLPGQVEAGDEGIVRRTLSRVAGYANWAEENQFEGDRESPKDFPISASTLALFRRLGFTNPVTVTLDDVHRVAFERVDSTGRAKLIMRGGPPDPAADAVLAMLSVEYVPVVGRLLRSDEFPANVAAVEALLEILGNTVEVAVGHLEQGVPAGCALQIAYYSLDHLTKLLPDSHKPLIGDISGNRLRMAAEAAQGIIERALTAGLRIDSDEVARLRSLP